MKNIASMTLLFSLLLFSACTWVQLTEEGEKVRVLEASEVTSCERVGQTTSTTAATVAGVPRHENALRDELESLARNSAINLGGDTIVPMSEISQGKQIFQVYRCVPQ